MISLKTIVIGNRLNVHVISDETASCAHTKLSIRNDKHEVCLNRVSRKRSLPTKIRKKIVEAHAIPTQFFPSTSASTDQQL